MGDLQALKEGIKYLFQNGDIKIDSAYHWDDPSSSDNPEDIVVIIDGEEVARFKDVLKHRHQ